MIYLFFLHFAKLVFVDSSWYDVVIGIEEVGDVVIVVIAIVVVVVVDDVVEVASGAKYWTCVTLVFSSTAF